MFVFVVMPFKIPELYEDIIKPTLEAEGCEVVRGDTHVIPKNIVKEIIYYLDRADLVIADLTGQNANVFYELGLAHAFLKPTFVITQDDINSLPFDLKTYRAYQYSFHHKNVGDFKEKLRRLVKAFHDGQLSVENPVSDFLPNYKTALNAPLSALAKEPAELLKDAHDAYYDQKDFGLSLILAETALEKWPNNTELYELAAKAAINLGKAEKAIKYGEVLSRRDPTKPQGFSTMADGHMMMGNWEEAIPLLKEVLRRTIDKYKSIVYHDLGKAYEKLGKLELALEAYGNFAKFTPNDDEKMLEIAEAKSEHIRNILNSE